MAFDMAISQLLASIIAGAIGFGLAKSGKAIWRPILGLVLGLIVGWLAGFALGTALLKGDSVNALMRAMGTMFWNALIFSGIGVFLGRRKLKSSEESKVAVPENAPSVAALGSSTATTPTPAPMQIFVSAETNHKMPASTTSPIAQSTNRSSNTLDEDHFYEVVANELETGNTDKGLWTRLFAEMDGDETKTKIAYIKQRVEKLMATRQHDEHTRQQSTATLSNPVTTSQVQQAIESLRAKGWFVEPKGANLFRVVMTGATVEAHMFRSDDELIDFARQRAVAF